jgi:leader peptidase (prepilin peptidase)/N-methyltransferase
MMMLIYAVPIICAAMTDWKKRIIPDWTWITILITGIFCAVIGESIARDVQGILYVPLIERITGLLYPAAALLIIALKWGGVGGGDIKLTAALGFAFGLYGLVFILFFAVAPACIYAGATRQKSVPLAVFLAAGFLAYVCIYFLIR